MEKKYQIFISSTYEDLKDERKKVQDTILEMYQFPIGMEMFSTANEEQWEIIKETIDSSDYYVLIIGHRYGSVIEKGEYSGISYTQKEFRYALEQKIPVLAFLIDGSVPVLPDNIEKNTSNKRKLTEFINEVKVDRTVQWWTSVEDLANKVMNSLNKQFSKGKRPGWVRADGLDLEGTQAELVELNRHVRRLEAENKELKNSVADRRPNLKVKVNNSMSLKIPFKECDQSLIDEEYEKISIDIVPEEAKHYITQEVIDKYNISLPSNEILENYKREIRFYKQAVDEPFNVDFSFSNIGRMKANDIYVEILIPNEIVIYKKDDKNIEVPKKPSKGMNPIDKYYKEANEDVYKGWSFIPYVKMPDLSIANTPTKHFINDNNNLSVRIDNLMIGYSWSIEDKYVLVPKTRGTFEIIVQFVCEEYGESKIQKIEVIVE